MPKPISAAETGPLRVVILTLDSHLASGAERAAADLKREIPGLELQMFAAVEWSRNPALLEKALEAIEHGDIIFANMLFIEEHIQAVMPALTARRPHCDAMVGAMSAGEVIKLTKLGSFDMSKEAKGPLKLLKKLRGSKKPGESSGKGQMAALRRLPKLLKFVPGPAQDVRAYFLILQYWLSGSDENLANLVRLLLDRYTAGPRQAVRGRIKVAAPVYYPEEGLYHPRLKDRIAEDVRKLPKAKRAQGRVGILVLRSYVLSGDTAHFDAVIDRLEARGLDVVPAFSSGLDARPAVEKFFMKNGEATVDAVLSLTGFSLVGGPAYNDAKAAEDILAQLDVPYVAAHGVEFQSLDQWEASAGGLSPVESTLMVAIPELDGATGPMVFGGRTRTDGPAEGRRMQPQPERVTQLAARVARLVALKRSERAERHLAIVLFNFPPNAGAVGTAAFLSVWASLHKAMQGLQAAGYDIEVPADAEALRKAVMEGNAQMVGADANVHAFIPVDDHVRRERHLGEIEGQWGPAPGKQLTDGRSLFVLGKQFGKVLIAIQPAFGYEGDPMRLLFEKGFTPTHAFSAFYRYLREDFAAHAVLHFGTHGALEFMPGKQTGLSGACWPDRLIGDLPNIYLYAANNPSEGAMAKRRAAATLVSYLTPSVTQAGLYRELADLKSSLDRWRGAMDEDRAVRNDLAALIQAQAQKLDLCAEDAAAWDADSEAPIAALTEQILELEYTLIPHGLHVLGGVEAREERLDMLAAMAEADPADTPPREALEALVDGQSLKPWKAHAALLSALSKAHDLMRADHELPALIHALDGGFIRPVAGGDVMRSRDVLPTGRNVHGFDPYRLPSQFAVQTGTQQAQLILDRHRKDTGELPRSVALVLWGTDNLKTEGGPIAQVLAIIGARPRFDCFGRLAGASLIPLEELGRPRIDVVVTLSGIFRDLLPLQTRMLAEACYLAAAADEPLEQNWVRAHTLAYQQAKGCDFDAAALRVFSNADGAYGANVNLLLDSGKWDEEDEFADAFTKRKCFAYGRDGQPAEQADLMTAMLADVDLTYQNLESVELGVTTIDHYFDTLGGISKAVSKARGESVPVYIGDQTTGNGKVRTLDEQVALETRTRTLNPKWYEGMLEHGYEGVRQIEAQITNTLGWSATTGKVPAWVYEQVTKTFIQDEEMRRRLAELNPVASAKLANRLIEAQERSYWTPDEDTLEDLRRAGDELEDQLEGVSIGAAA